MAIQQKDLYLGKKGEKTLLQNGKK